MSKSILFTKDAGTYKRSNGVEFIRYQEREAFERNLGQVGAYMNTRGNLYYYKLRDDINAIQKRIYNKKLKDVDQQNEKMFKKLTQILRSEGTSFNEKRKHVGPKSLNIGVRKRSVQKVNKDNIKLSDRLLNAKCNVDSIENHRSFFEKHKQTQGHMTIWKKDG